MRRILLLGMLATGVASWSAVGSGPAFAQAGAGIVSEIRIEGSQRIDPATVQSYMVVNPGDAFDPARINQSLKSLYATGLFSDVIMEREGNALIVKVDENPVINRIAFEGNRQIEDDALEAEVQLRPRVVYTATRVKSDMKRILDLYRRSGRFAAQVVPKIIELEQNRVDLVFEVDEGEETGINRIMFIGNDVFSDGKLGSVINTQESRWWAVFRTSDTYDPDRLTFDRELLRRFYLKEGYADFRVMSAVAELTPDKKGFFVTFTIDEGERYRFGQGKVDSRIPNLDLNRLSTFVLHEQGDWYNAEQVEQTVTALTDELGNMGYAFIDIRPKVDKDEKGRIASVTYEIGEGPKVFVERIDIQGNFRTEDEVIRREFRLVEGDAFNTSKLRRSRQRIQNLGFFSKVDVRTTPGSTPEKTVVEVEVEEQSTGELSFGLGYSTADGVLGDISIRERNLLGRGQELRFSFTGSMRNQQIDLGFTEPYFLGKPLSAGVDVFSVNRDRQSESSFDEQELGFRLRTGYDISENLSQSLRYTLKRTEITDVGSSASTFIKQQEGARTVSELGQTIVYDQRDNRIAPTDGWYAKLSNDLAGLGGDVTYLRSSLEGGYYLPLFENVNMSSKARAGTILGLGEDVDLSDRFFLGGQQVRGFTNAGLGARDTSTGDNLGGTVMFSGSTQVEFPLGLPEELGVKGRTFIDYGMLTDVPETGTYVKDSASLRASAGVGIGWNSPFGPINLDWAWPLMKEDFDETENFRISFGTNF